MEINQQLIAQHVYIGKGTVGVVESGVYSLVSARSIRSRIDHSHVRLMHARPVSVFLLQIPISNFLKFT